MVETGESIGNLFVRVGVDDLPAVNGLRNINSQVRTLNNSWKAQEAYLNSVGDKLGAAKARYEGLGDTIQRQKEYVEALKQQQNKANEEIAKSKEHIAALKKEMSEYTTAEEKSQKRYKELSADLKNYTKILERQKKTYSAVSSKIEGAKNKLASFAAQQKRSAGSMEYYASGADKVKTSLREMTTSSDLMIQRLKAEGKTYQANYEQSRLYANQLSKMSDLHKRLTRSLSSIAESQGKDSDAYRKTASSLEKLDTQMAKTKSEQDKLNESFSSSHLGVAKIRDSYDKMNKSVHKIGTGFKESAGKIVSGVAIAGASVAGLSAGFVVASESAQKLQNSYKVTSNLLVTGGEKQAEVTKKVSEMQKQGRDLSLKYGKSQQSIAEAYQDLVKRGDTSAQALGAMNSMVQASVASGDDLADVTQVTSNVMESFRMKVDSTGKQLTDTKEVTKRTKKAVNELAFAADKTSTKFQDLGIGMSYVGSTAKNAGFSLSETTSAMGILSNNGLEADKAGTGLRKAINSLTSPTKDAVGALNSLGLSTKDFVDKSGKLKSMSDIFGLLNEKTKDMAKAKKADIFHSIFGTTGQQAGLILADNATQLQKLNKEVANAADENYVGKLADKNMGTAKNAMNRFKMVAQDVEMTLASAVLPTISKMAESMSRVADTKGFRSMVNTVGRGFEAIGDKLQGMFNYISKNSDAFTSMGKSVSTIIGEFGSGVWSAFSGTIKTIATGIRLAFGDASTQSGAQSIASALKDVASHAGEIKALGEVLGTYFVAKKILGIGKGFFTMAQGIRSVGTAIKDIKAGKGILNSISGISDYKNVDYQVVSKSKSIAEHAAESAGKTAGKAKILEKVFGSRAENVAKMGTTTGGKFVSGISIALGAFDIGKAFFDKGHTAKYTDAGKGIGTLLGTGIGAIFGGPVGASIGGTLGHAIGSFAGNELGKMTVKGPKISMKQSYDQLHKENQAYIKQQTADLNTLLKAGDITKQEYNQRSKEIQAGNKRLSALDKMSAETRHAVAKYYAEKRSQLESKYDKQTEKDKKYWDNKIYQDTQKFGADSEKVQEDQKKRSLAIQADKNKKKAALQKQANDFTKKSTIEEAKENETLTGKLQKANRIQLQDYDKLVTQKGKLSNKEMQTLVNNAQTEYNKIVSLSHQEFEKQKKDANQKYQSIKKNADATRDAAIKAANDQYNKVVDAAYREYQGTDKNSVQQRNNIINNAKTQRDNAVNAANDQHTKVVKHASQQRDSAIQAALKQQEETKKQAALQKEKVTDAAKEQSHGVVTHATKQANSSMKANADQAGGLGSIWKNIIKFFNALTKPFGVKAIEAGSLSAAVPQTVSGLAYATGGGIPTAGKALVGEAGPELRYKPYSGKFDILGAQGAQFADLEAGDEILNADDTAKLLSGNYIGTLPGYANGTSDLSDFIKKVKDKAGDIFDDIKDDAFKAIKDIGNPIDKLKDIAKKAFNLDSVKDLGNVPHDISKGAVDKSIHSIGDFLKNLVDKVKEHAEASVGGFGKIPEVVDGKNLRDLVKKALEANGLSTSDDMIARVMRQIATESGGNAHAVQPGADPDGDGSGPALGLMQTKRSTFNAYKAPGHDDIFNAYDNLLAALNYAKHRYGPSLSFLGNGHGYANGGIATEPSIFGEAGPEMAVPLAIPKRSRGFELLGQLVTMFAADEKNNLSTESHYNNDRMEELLEQNNKLMEALIGIASGSLDAIKSGNTNTQVAKGAFYNAFGMDQKRTEFQSF